MDCFAWTADDCSFLGQCGPHTKTDAAIKSDDAWGEVLRKYHGGLVQLAPDLLDRTWERFAPVVNEVLEQGEICGGQYDCIVIGHDGLRKQVATG
jgi:hypothetical protein